MKRIGAKGTGRGRAQATQQLVREIMEDLSVWGDAAVMVGLPSLKEIIARTLARLPETIRGRARSIVFMGLAYEQLGEAFEMYFPLAPGEDAATAKVVLLSERLCKKSAAKAESCVAHEIAHVVLGHTDVKGTKSKGANIEREADDLAEEWGFRRSYTEAHLRRLEGHAARLKRAMP